MQFYIFVFYKVEGIILLSCTMNQTTIKEIAKRLDIAISTASRALSDHPAISEATKLRVKALAKELDYQPNILAYNLKKRRSNSIGIIVPDLAHHYFANIISGVQEVLYLNGYNLVICQSNDDEKREMDLVDMLLSNQVEGLLISINKVGGNYDHFKKIIEREVPLVFFDRICEPLIRKAPTVTINDFNAALTATVELINLGCKNIAIIGAPQTLNIGKNRLLGFKEALRINGLPFDESKYYESNLTIENSKQITYKILAQKNRPDAIFVCAGLATIGTLIVLRENGFSLEKEIKVAGFLGELYPGHKEQGLLRIYSPTFEMGRESANLLLNSIKNLQAAITHLQLDTILKHD